VAASHHLRDRQHHDGGHDDVDRQPETEYPPFAEQRDENDSRGRSHYGDDENEEQAEPIAVVIARSRESRVGPVRGDSVR
jgi:hypothetical protein